MRLPSSLSETTVISAWPLSLPHLLASGSGAENGPARPVRLARATAASDELPYTVELWALDGNTVEQVLAVTAHGSIGYAAYYAATREYPERIIILRRRNQTIARSDTPRN